MADSQIGRIKIDLRITHDKLDESIKDRISEARRDMRNHGIIYATDADPLILAACRLYCLSELSEDADKRTEFRLRYEKLRDGLSQTEGYGWTSGGLEDQGWGKNR